MARHANELHKIIHEYEEERAVVKSRLDTYTQRRTHVEFAHQVLIEHGSHAEADRLNQELDELARHVNANIEILARIDQLLQGFRTSLEKIESPTTTQ